MRVDTRMQIKLIVALGILGVAVSLYVGSQYPDRHQRFEYLDSEAKRVENELVRGRDRKSLLAKLADLPGVVAVADSGDKIPIGVAVRLIHMPSRFVIDGAVSLPAKAGVAIGSEGSSQVFRPCPLWDLACRGGRDWYLLYFDSNDKLIGFAAGTVWMELDM